MELGINNTHPADHKIAINSPMNKETQRIQMVSIDHFLAEQNIVEPISFIKIDVQGYELDVCRGMAETIRRNPDVILALEVSENELNHFRTNVSTLLELLTDSFRNLYLIKANGQIDCVTPTEIQERINHGRGYLDVLVSNRALSAD
jgi:hypothetical protein